VMVVAYIEHAIFVGFDFGVECSHNLMEERPFSKTAVFSLPHTITQRLLVNFIRIEGALFCSLYPFQKMFLF
jgi:hypothetical protein